MYCSLSDLCVPIKEPEISVSVQLLTRIGRAVDKHQLVGCWRLRPLARGMLRERRADPEKHEEVHQPTSPAGQLHLDGLRFWW